MTTSNVPARAGRATPKNDKADGGNVGRVGGAGKTDKRDFASKATAEVADLLFVLVRHADDCPMLLPTPGACMCNPRMVRVSEDEFARQFLAERRRRTELAQAAADALHKACGARR